MAPVQATRGSSRQGSIEPENMMIKHEIQTAAPQLWQQLLLRLHLRFRGWLNHQEYTQKLLLLFGEVKISRLHVVGVNGATTAAGVQDFFVITVWRSCSPTGKLHRYASKGFTISIFGQGEVAESF
jgi:hypothetical protein